MASIKDQLNKIILKKFKFKNGKTLEQTLMEAVDYLYICIQNEIDYMYESYDPIYYERRPYFEGLHNALYVEDFIDAQIKDNRIELSLKFNSNVWAWNFDHTHKSNVAVLMHEGWEWKKHGKIPDRFRWFEGYPFIKNGVDAFNRNNKWGVRISWDIDPSDWY